MIRKDHLKSYSGHTSSKYLKRCNYVSHLISLALVGPSSRLGKCFNALTFTHMLFDSPWPMHGFVYDFVPPLPDSPFGWPAKCMRTMHLLSILGMRLLIIWKDATRVFASASMCSHLRTCDVMNFCARFDACALHVNRCQHPQSSARWSSSDWHWAFLIAIWFVVVPDSSFGFSLDYC